MAEFHPTLLWCSFIHYDGNCCGLHRRVCTWNIWCFSKYHRMGHAQFAFGTFSVWRSPCFYPWIHLDKRANDLGYGGVNDTRGGGCLFTPLSLSAFTFQTSSSRRIFCVLRCFRIKCRGDFRGLGFIDGGSGPEFMRVQPDEGSLLSFCFFSVRFRDLSRI